jgi:hypothetical protein
MSEFVYDKMTNELKAFLDHRNSAALERNAWNAECNRLKDALQPGELTDYSRARKIWLCRDETRVGELVEELSPSDKYSLVITKHDTGKGTWAYSKGRVYRGEQLLCEICRNYSSFPSAWVEEHPKGDFLICGEDYQGQTVVNLLTGEVKSFLPNSASAGQGFCWAEINPSPDKQLLAVVGCYWGATYEIEVFDFSDPMNLPWPALTVTPTPADGIDSFDSWNDNNTFCAGAEVEFVNLPGHALHERPSHSLSGDEWDEVEKETRARGITGFDAGLVTNSVDSVLFTVNKTP